MDNKTNWTFEDFHADLKNLKPKVREKAIEIAIELMNKNGFNREKSIKEGIKKAEEWFYNLEG